MSDDYGDGVCEHGKAHTGETCWLCLTKECFRVINLRQEFQYRAERELAGDIARIKDLLNSPAVQALPDTTEGGE